MKSRKRKIRIIKHSSNPEGFTAKLDIWDETYAKIYNYKFSLRDERAVYNVLKAIESIIDTSIVGIIKKFNKTGDKFW
jgi:hypothetical protein|tara:strand:+ start:583 stop:816 length:234 start_codon:yes stop_codon:yes gene_type:complete